MNFNLNETVVYNNNTSPSSYNHLINNNDYDIIWDIVYDSNYLHLKSIYIQRWFRNIKFLQKIHHIGQLNQVNTELKYLPNIGYKYFESKTNFEFLQ
jgi:hypothetical protein